MGAEAREAFRISIFIVACAAVVGASIGCQSSGVAVSPTNPMCPVCGSETQVQPTATASTTCTKAICPICGDVATVDRDFLDRLEVFSGGPIGDTVYACAKCGTIAQECAACRQKGYVATGRGARGWQWGLPSTAR